MTNHETFYFTEKDIYELEELAEKYKHMTDAELRTTFMPDLSKQRHRDFLLFMSAKRRSLLDKQSRMNLIYGEKDAINYIRHAANERRKLGERIAEARLWAGYKRSEMADVLGVGYAAYVHFEAGDAFMDLERIVLFQKLTNVDLNWMIRTSDGHYRQKYRKPPTKKVEKIRLRYFPTEVVFGARPKLLRMRMNYSRKDMGYYLHVGERGYGYYETGRSFLGLNQLVKLRMAMGVDLNGLFACKADLTVKYSTAPYFRLAKLDEYISI